MKSFYKNLIIKILILESRLVLRKYKPKIIAITGNVGKTTTKEAIGLVLSNFVELRKSEKSFNSEFGVPLTILGLPNAWSNPFDWFANIVKGALLVILPRKYPKFLVLEIGAGKPGDIKKISEWLPIDVLVVTRFPDVPVHIEFFKSREHLLEEKSQLLKSVSTQGLIVLNHDDKDVLNLKTGIPNKVLSFGLSPEASIYASNVSLWYPDSKDIIPSGLQFKANYGGTSIPIFMGRALSNIHIYAALSALLVATHFEFSLLEAAHELSKWEGISGRLSMLLGIKKTIIIDDTYNAAPTSMEAAIDVLEKLPIEKRKIAVLGDMLELGKFTKDAHIAIGKYTFGKCNILVTVGKRAEFIKEGAIAAGMIPEHIFSFRTAEDAGEFLQKSLEEGDIVLLKASQGMRLERAVEMIMAHPEDKKNLLARQEKEWLVKK